MNVALSASVEFSDAREGAVRRLLKPAKKRPVLAYRLLCGLGLQTQQLYCPSSGCANRRHECCVFTIGRRVLDKLEVFPRAAHAALTHALATPNGG